MANRKENHIKLGSVSYGLLSYIINIAHLKFMSSPQPLTNIFHMLY